MRFTCQDPLNEVTRVMDIARKLNLELVHLSISRRDGGAYALDLRIADAATDVGRRFEAQVRALPTVAQEMTDV